LDPRARRFPPLYHEGGNGTASETGLLAYRIILAPRLPAGMPAVASFATFVPGYSGGSATASHRLPSRPLRASPSGILAADREQRNRPTAGGEGVTAQAGTAGDA
jgi:hypothetical protein